MNGWLIFFFIPSVVPVLLSFLWYVVYGPVVPLPRSLSDLATADEYPSPPFQETGTGIIKNFKYHYAFVSRFIKCCVFFFFPNASRTHFQFYVNSFVTVTEISAHIIFNVSSQCRKYFIRWTRYSLVWNNSVWKLQEMHGWFFSCYAIFQFLLNVFTDLVVPLSVSLFYDYRC